MGTTNNPPLAEVFARNQVDEKLSQIKAYIDEQSGNDPEDKTGWKVMQEIFATLFFIQTYPFSSKQVRGASKNYRQRRAAASYMIYYYVTNEGNKVYLIDPRHTSQRPLKSSTLRKYKSEIEENG